MVAALSLNTQLVADDEPRSLEVVVERDPERHRAFVLDSWTRSYQPLMPQYAKTYGMDRWVWVRFCAESLVGRDAKSRERYEDGRVPPNRSAGAILLGAYVEGYPDAMLGWICGSPGVLHYAYVSNQARRKGVASNLLGALLPHIGPVNRITHRPGTGRGNLRAKAHDLGWRYEPLTREELENL